MAGRDYFSEFELLVMLSVVRLGDAAYGVPIAREIEKFRGKTVVLGSVYATLSRLEQQGMVSSNVGEATPERGGRAKRYFDITNAGLRELNQTKNILSEMWLGLPTIRKRRV